MSKRIACLLMVLVLVLASAGTAVSARQPDRTYTYDGSEAVPSTNIYKVKKYVDENVMGCTRMKDPSDIFVDSTDRIFIMDSGNCRVLILDENYRCIKELKEFNYNGEVITLAEGAEGIFFRETSQQLYIADTENERILITDLDGNISRISKRPADDRIDPALAYKPSKIIVDNMGIMFVRCATINTGFLMIDSQDTFLGYYGVNKLKLTPQMQLEFFWRSLLNDTQGAQSMLSFQPVEYFNLFWSQDRFIYAVSPVSDSMETSVVKLNALGDNVFFENIDFEQIQTYTAVKPMQLMDITVDDEGIISIIENKTGRIYQYDQNCNLLAAFGGLGYQEGLFTQLMSIEADSKNNLLILDGRKCSVTVMDQTYYGERIRVANALYNEGRYLESVEPWLDVLRMNANYTQAYVGLGKAYIAMEDYEKAMEHFKIAKDKEGYAEAKANLRDETVREYFGLIATVVILALIAILGYDQIKVLILRVYWRLRK